MSPRPCPREPHIAERTAARRLPLPLLALAIAALVGGCGSTAAADPGAALVAAVSPGASASTSVDGAPGGAPSPTATGTPADSAAAPSATAGGSDDSAPSPAAAASSPSPDAAHVVLVPATIDPTGRKPVTAALQALVDATPDGSTIKFRARATYLLDGPILVTDRHDLTFLGNGATFKASGAPPETPGDQFRIQAGENITLRGLTIMGANWAPGYYDFPRRWDSAIVLFGAHHVEIDGAAIKNTYGDCVDIEMNNRRNQDFDWSADIYVHDSTCQGAGRQGVSVTGGRNVVVRRMHFIRIAFSPLDLEPYLGSPRSGASGVTFEDNVIDGFGHDSTFAPYFAEAAGPGPVDHLIVRNNVVHGQPLLLLVDGIGSRFRRSHVIVSGNRSDTPAAGPVMKLLGIDGLWVSDNKQPLRSGRLTSVTACTAVDLTSAPLQ